MILRSQKIELNPNNKQSTKMSQHCGYARVAFNYVHSSFVAGLDADNFKSVYDLKKEFNANKYDLYPWCKDLSQNVSKNAIHNHADAVKRWVSKQNSFPRYKRRSGKESYQAENGAGSIRVEHKRIHLPKVGSVRMREELRWRGQVRRVTISRTNGRWFASILVAVDDPYLFVQHSLLPDNDPIGIDVGINTLATCSDGSTYENPRPLKRNERKLKRANRRLSRREKGGRNWYKSKRMLQAVHYRIACIRDDAHHKASTDIVRKASAIGVETLNIRGLLKNKKLAKHLSDAALSKFLGMIKYKADRRGIPITEAPMFYASSKTCSGCGNKKTDMTLSDRQYECESCGLSIDRDLNAAINLCPE